MPSYLPILILGALALGFGVFTLVLSYIFGRPRPDEGKLSTYECGMPVVGSARERFPVKFYLVCMLFILFDVETAFFYRPVRVLGHGGVLPRPGGRVHLRVEGRSHGLVAAWSSPPREGRLSTRSSPAIR
jgi:hypothetical protein